MSRQANKHHARCWVLHCGVSGSDRAVSEVPRYLPDTPPGSSPGGARIFRLVARIGVPLHRARCHVQQQNFAMLPSLDGSPTLHPSFYLDTCRKTLF
jgi:hypothetical protein